MKYVKKCNYLYILAILAILFIGIIMIMKMKESMIFDISTNTPPNNFITTNKVLNVPINSNLDVPVTLFNMIDYSGNDISYNNSISYSDCFYNCANNNLCKGIVTDFDKNIGPGQCWMKSDMSIHVMNQNKYSTKFNR